MTKNQAKQIFEKYNPKGKVVRCPNGRAGVRNMLDSYAKAAVNLYGIIPIKELAEIFNSQNAEQTTADEIFMVLLPEIIKKIKTEKEPNYCFYKDCIVPYAAIDNFDFADYLLIEQNNKPRFIPLKDDLLKYEDIYYEDPKQELLWSKVLDCFLNNFHSLKFPKLFFKIKNNSQMMGKMDFDELLKENDFSFNTENQIQNLLDSLNNAHNNTRMWINKGHTPNELMEMRKKEYQKRGNEPIMVREHRKIGPNEPCPCGSGKKYKKCCRLIQEERTAQLHWSECNLFYETWYGLLGFINEKKKIIPVRIKPIYPNDLSDEVFFKVREELWKNPEIITEYLASASLPTSKAELLKSWRDHHIKGMFCIVDYKPEYAVAFGSDINKEDILYGIKGISRSIAEAFQQELPIQIETVLLPFKDKIIYDSYLTSMNISYGNNMKKMFADNYKKAAEKGIITRLG